MNDADFGPSAIEEIKILKKLFDGAEKFAKEDELFQTDLSIPAINELRYAGPHLLKRSQAKTRPHFRRKCSC